MKILYAGLKINPVLRNCLALSSANICLTAEVHTCCFRSSWNSKQSLPVLLHTRSLKKDVFSADTLQSENVKLFKKDKVPESFELVYVSPNLKLYRYGISLFMFGVLSACTLGILGFCATIVQGKLSAYAYLLPFGILIFSWKCFKNLPARLYYSKSTNEFYMVVLRHGWRRKFVQFSPRQVEKLGKSAFGNVTVQGHRMFINDEGFLDIGVYNRFMSFAPYDKGNNISKTDKKYLKEMEQKSKETTDVVREHLKRKHKTKNSKE